nr:MAG TPA: hypothetical protein [Caudoviricetes sp.]
MMIYYTRERKRRNRSTIGISPSLSMIHNKEEIYYGKQNQNHHHHRRNHQRVQRRGNQEGPLQECQACCSRYVRRYRCNLDSQRRERLRSGLRVQWP